MAELVRLVLCGARAVESVSGMALIRWRLHHEVTVRVLLIPEHLRFARYRWCSVRSLDLPLATARWGFTCAQTSFYKWSQCVGQFTPIHYKRLYLNQYLPMGQCAIA